MNNLRICVKCERKYEIPTGNYRCDCGGRLAPVCEKLNCEKPGIHHVYAMGYIACVCEQHYLETPLQDREDANRFRYAEG